MSPQGTVIVAGRSLPYKSAQQAQKLVLDELQSRDSSFLDRCDKDRRFHGKKRRFIARNKKDLGTHSEKCAQEIGGGWGWMSVQTQTQQKWKLIQWAAEVAKLCVKVKGECWVAEARSRVKVGF